MIRFKHGKPAIKTPVGGGHIWNVAAIFPGLMAVQTADQHSAGARR